MPKAPKEYSTNAESVRKRMQPHGPPPANYYANGLPPPHYHHYAPPPSSAPLPPTTVVPSAASSAPVAALVPVTAPSVIDLTKIDAESEDLAVDSDDEVEIVEAAPVLRKLEVKKFSYKNDGEDEVVVVGTAKVPHMRQNCPEYFPYSAVDNSKHQLFCSKCYCYVRDTKVKR